MNTLTETEERGLADQLCEAMQKKSLVLDALESMARQHCLSLKAERDYNGQVAGTTVTHSGALSADAEALEVLAAHGRFRVVASSGRMVVGYWPENDPQKKKAE